MVSSGSASSSVMVTSASEIVRSGAVACTVSFSSSSSRVSCLGARLKVFSPLNSPAAIVMLKSLTPV